MRKSAVAGLLGLAIFLVACQSTNTEKTLSSVVDSNESNSGKTEQSNVSDSKLADSSATDEADFRDNSVDPISTASTEDDAVNESKKAVTKKPSIVSSKKSEVKERRKSEQLAKPAPKSKTAPKPDQTKTASIKPETKQSAPVTKKMAARMIAGMLVKAYTPPRPGTIFTWRNNWASLPDLISYKVNGLVTIGGKEYVKLTSVAGLKETVHAYYDTQNFALKGYRDSSNKAMLSYKPAEQRYRFPLKTGDAWITAWKSYDHRKQKEISGGGRVQVMGAEMLKTPAGTFKAVKVRMPGRRGMPANMRHYIWFAPDLGVTVKEQIDAGSMRWTQILEKISRSG